MVVWSSQKSALKIIGVIRLLHVCLMALLLAESIIFNIGNFSTIIIINKWTSVTNTNKQTCVVRNILGCSLLIGKPSKLILLTFINTLICTMYVCTYVH